MAEGVDSWQPGPELDRTLNNGSLNYAVERLDHESDGLRSLSVKLPLGWEARVDENTQRIYYLNINTQHTQWTLPTDDTLKNELHVDANDSYTSGVYQTLSYALQNAAPGATIYVKSGIYREHIMITKDVTIVGRGVDPVVIVSDETYSVMCSAKNVVLDGLHLENHRKQTEKAQATLVLVNKTACRMSRCEIYCRNGLSAIEILDKSVPHISNCIIRNEQGIGIFMREEAAPILQENTVHSCGGASVVVSDGARPTATKNKICKGQTEGIVISGEGSGGIYEENRISAQGGACIAICCMANPVVRRNVITDSKSYGIHVFDNATGVVEDNEIVRSRNCGISISLGADPSVTNNSVAHGCVEGIAIHRNGKGAIKSNRISSHNKAGIRISDGSDPLVQYNTISCGGMCGIWLWHGAKGTVSHNDISDTRGAGVEIDTNADPTVTNNRIHHGHWYGVWIHEHGRGTIENNDIFLNIGSAIHKHSHSTANVGTNKMYDNGKKSAPVRHVGITSLTRGSSAYSITSPRISKMPSLHE